VFIGHSAGKAITNASNNVAIGYRASFTNSTAARNIAIGTDALYTSTAADNLAIGYRALYLSNTGQYNTAIGHNASYTLTSGNNNVSFGYNASYSNSTGGSNTAIGYRALYTSSSSNNTAVGADALYSATTGSFNVAVGSNAATAVTTGGNNTAVGLQALNSCQTGYWNVALGYDALRLCTNSSNTAVGAQALRNDSTGTNNVGIGRDAFYSLTTGSGNIGIGHNAGLYQADSTTALATPTNSIYIGKESKGFSDSDSNSIVIGYQAIGKGANTTILGNSSTTQTWLGGGELRLPGSTSGYVGLKGAATAGSVTYTLPSADGTSGQVLSTNGSAALSWATVASSGGTVTSVGGTGTVNGLTLTGTVTSSGNLTLGGTLSVTASNFASQTANTVLAAPSGAAGTPSFRALVAADIPTLNQNTTGTSANVTGTVAIANGGTGQTTAANAVNALLPTQTSNSGKFLTTNGTVSSWATVSANPAGSSGQVQYNNGGSFAGASKIKVASSGWLDVSDAPQNLGIGNSVFVSTVTGAYNTSAGCWSGEQTRSGMRNSFFGYGAGYSTNDGSNNSCLGYQSIASSSWANNEITLGDSSIATLRCQVTSITSLSDQRDKTNIQPMPSVLSFIASLNPVQFDWWMRDGAKTGVPDYGFIAQELKQAQSSNGFDWAQLVYESNPEKLEASPGKLIPILVKAIQELAAKVAALEAAI
jgi:hypothetical protein